MVLEGKAYWAHITKPNEKYTPVYSINLLVDDAIAKEYADRGFSIKHLEEGPTLVIKRKVTGNYGPNTPPLLVDKNKKPFRDAIGNGSTVRVQCSEWQKDWKGTMFYGLDLQAVQVIDLIPYSSADGEELGISELENELEEL